MDRDKLTDDQIAEEVYRIGLKWKDYLCKFIEDLGPEKNNFRVMGPFFMNLIEDGMIGIYQPMGINEKAHKQVKKIAEICRENAAKAIAKYEESEKTNG